MRELVNLFVESPFSFLIVSGIILFGLMVLGEIIVGAIHGHSK